MSEMNSWRLFNGMMLDCCSDSQVQPFELYFDVAGHIVLVIKYLNRRGGACSAQSGRGKQRPYIWV